MRELIVMTVLAFILSTPSSLAGSGANDTQELTAPSAPTGPIVLSSYTGSAIAVEPVNMTPIDTRDFGRGAECPRGSGRYCSSSIPFCCRSSSGTPYCAPNSNGCTR